MESKVPTNVRREWWT